MPKLTQDLNETWYLEDLDFDRWEVPVGVTIDAVGGGNGIVDFTDGGDIVVNGTVIARSDGDAEFAGVYTQGYGSSITIGHDGYIDATGGHYGVASLSHGNDVTNHGLIEAARSGIYGTKGIDIENYGTIRASNGLELQDGNFNVHNAGTIIGSGNGVYAEVGDFSILVNDSSGKIQSSNIGIYLLGDVDGSATIINDGLIKGAQFAIFASSATMEITNRGTIVGDILTGEGDDIINTRDGVFKGTLRGAGGNDVYIIGRSKVTINETEDGGVYDFVQSTATYRLTDNVESLQLSGRKNINAFGNDDANILTGNSGKNVLSGDGGADAIYSVQGDDRMTGGEGADVFVFGRDYDRDRITDFEDGVDTLFLLGITDQQEFDALKIRQSHGDVIIDYGRGDQLIIEDFKKQDLTLDDLLIP